MLRLALPCGFASPLSYMLAPRQRDASAGFPYGFVHTGFSRL